MDIPHLPTIDSLQGTNIPHHWKRNIILKDGLDRNTFVSSRVTLWLQDFVDVARYTTLEESGKVPESIGVVNSCTYFDSEVT